MSSFQVCAVCNNHCLFENPVNLNIIKQCNLTDGFVFKIQTRFVGPVSMFERIRKQDEAAVDGVCALEDVEGDPVADIVSVDMSIC